MVLLQSKEGIKMLKKIPPIISPELMKVLMEMGHGDELLIADGNYPKFGQSNKVVRMDGHGVVDILEAILPFFPLDSYVQAPVILMDVLKDDPYQPVIWKEYQDIIDFNNENEVTMEKIHKHDFYPRGKEAYAVITTSETELYANIILKKGVVMP